MSENHNHDHPQDQVQQSRQPAPGTIIAYLNKSLDQRANEVRQLQDREVYLLALHQDVDNENTSLKAILDQVRAENILLRERCGLPEAGPIDPVEDEAIESEPTEVLEGEVVPPTE